MGGVQHRASGDDPAARHGVRPPDLGRYVERSKRYSDDQLSAVDDAAVGRPTEPRGAYS